MSGKTQNPNECLNKVIWSRCPKEIWTSYKTVQQAVYAAVAQFNDDNMAFIRTMHQFGNNPGNFCLAICKKQDAKRITKSNGRSSVDAKQKRKTLRAFKKVFKISNKQKKETHMLKEHCRQTFLQFVLEKTP